MEELTEKGAKSNRERVRIIQRSERRHCLRCKKQFTKMLTATEKHMKSNRDMYLK
jgi:hypothetical protein